MTHFEEIRNRAFKFVTENKTGGCFWTDGHYEVSIRLSGIWFCHYAHNSFDIFLGGTLSRGGISEEDWIAEIEEETGCKFPLENAETT